MKNLWWLITHLGAWVLMLLAAAGLGHCLLRRLSFYSVTERIVFTLALGLGVWALIFFSLGVLGVLYQAAIWGLTVSSALGTVLYFCSSQQNLRSFCEGRWKEYYRSHAALAWILVAGALCYWVLLLLITQFPPMHWDAISNHLVLARDYLLEHRVYADFRVSQFVLPALNHLLFTWALALKDDILAQMVEHTFMMLTALALYTWGQRQNQPLLGVAAAFLWLSHPLVLWVGSSGYVDVGITCYAFLGIYALRLFWDEHKAAWWYLGIMLLGMAAGVKMPGLFFLAVGGGLGIWWCLRSRLAWQALCVGGVLAFFVAAPWYGFIAYHTGNPFWPMFPQFSRGLHDSQEAVTVFNGWFGFGIPKTISNFLLLPYHMAVNPEKFHLDAMRGYCPIIFAWPLSWFVALWNRSVRWWVLWALAFTAFWFSSAQFQRYWMPAVPIVGLALCESIRWCIEKLSRTPILLKAAWIILILATLPYGPRTAKAEITEKGFLPPTNQEERDRFLEIMAAYKGVQYLNKHVAQHDVVYLINSWYLNYYITPRVMIGSSLNPGNKQPRFSWPEDISWVEWLDSQNIRWVFMNHAEAGELVSPPKENPLLNPFWPALEVAYADAHTYVFRRLPVSLEAVVKPSPVATLSPCAALTVSNGQGSAGNKQPQSNPRAQPAADKLATYEGYHDTAGCGVIIGWAWNPARPDAPVKIDLFDGETLIATVNADQPRADLAAAGKGNGRHGFTYTVPPCLKDRKQHSMRVKIAGTSIDLSHTPKTIGCLPEETP